MKDKQGPDDGGGGRVGDGNRNRKKIHSHTSLIHTTQTKLALSPVGQGGGRRRRRNQSFFFAGWHHARPDALASEYKALGRSMHGPTPTKL
jgi:hypothetical protein